MKIKLDLIPRFNLDYKFADLTYGLKHIIINSRSDLGPLKRLFGNKNFFFTNNGRSSLYVILKSLNMPKGSKVGVPLYSCTVVFDAILKAGYVPYFIDIDLCNYTLDPKDLENKINEISAVVVIHTFGRPADMERIREVAKKVPIIEDCSHSILSEYKGKITGTIADASFFSLAKYISAGGGGMIVINNDELIDNITQNIHLLDTSSALSDIWHAFFTYMYSCLYHKPWYGGFAFNIGSHIKSDVNMANKRIFKTTQIRNIDLNVFLNKLKDFKEKVELQRKNSQLLIDELKDTDLVLPYEHQDAWHNYFYYPILFSNKERRDGAYEFLNNMGIDTAKLFGITPTMAREFYGYKGDCPNAENLADRVLVVPNYYTLNNKSLLKIISSIKEIEGFYENNGGSGTSKTCALI